MKTAACSVDTGRHQHMLKTAESPTCPGRPIAKVCKARRLSEPVGSLESSRVSKPAAPPCAMQRKFKSAVSMKFLGTSERFHSGRDSICLGGRFNVLLLIDYRSYRMLPKASGNSDGG